MEIISICFLFFVFLFILRISLFILGLNFLINDYICIYEFELFSLNRSIVIFIIYFDWIRLIFISFVLLISRLVTYYRKDYMAGDYNINRFILTVLLFVFSIIILIIRPNLIRILLGWDGLGLVSYCLVIYYQNEIRFNCGIVTVLTNRIGDTLILLILGYFLIYGSFNFIWLNKFNTILIFLIIIISFTKRAQIPFSSWLPKAIAAPTPVSSLVHSSTLVTAGVYLLIRFNYLIQIDKLIISLLIFLSLITIFISGLIARVEYDLKKIIALSTLSQLGLIIFCLSLNIIEVTFFHLFTHAIFKSILFICAGVIIHNIILNQDIRFLRIGFFNIPVVRIIFSCSGICLIGIPFLSGFFSKDKIIDIFILNNYINNFIFILFFFSLGLTTGYLIRLLYFVIIKNPVNIIYIKFYRNLNLIIYSIIFLFLFTNFIGFILRWLLFSFKRIIYLTLKIKLLIYIYIIIGIILEYL